MIPSETGEALKALTGIGFTRMRAIHVIGNLFTLELFRAQQGEPFNERRYAGRLRLIAQGAGDLDSYRQLFRRIGRNDACPCGSGKKFKRCCVDVFPVPLDSASWAFSLSGGTPYYDEGYPATAADDDVVLLLGNISAVAVALEKLGDLDGALQTLHYMVDLARLGGPDVDDLLSNTRYDLIEFAESHAAYASEGLVAVEELSSQLGDASEEQFELSLTRADLLTLMGRVSEGERLYDEAGQTDLPHETTKMLLARRQYWEEQIKPRALR